MPQSSDRLRERFNFGNGNDGITEAESCISKYGGIVNSLYCIILPKSMLNTEFTEELEDAINFLCEEWDYAFSGFLL